MNPPIPIKPSRVFIRPHERNVSIPHNGPTLNNGSTPRNWSAGLHSGSQGFLNKLVLQTSVPETSRASSIYPKKGDEPEPADQPQTTGPPRTTRQSQATGRHQTTGWQVIYESAGMCKRVATFLNNTAPRVFYSRAGPSTGTCAGLSAGRPQTSGRSPNQRATGRRHFCMRSWWLSLG